MRTQRAAPSAAALWVQGAAGLSLAAGFIHMLATPPYFELWVGYGMFFVLAVTAQMSYAVLLWMYHTLWQDQPHRAWLWAGIIGNGLIIALWLFTRVVGVPVFGPQAWQVQPVGVLDLLAVIFEAGLIACLVMLLRSQSDDTH
jgi:hypothetical protein